MARFADSFDPFRQDIVYGRTEARTDYLEDFFESPQLSLLEKKYQKSFGIYSKGYYINDYNEVITKGDLSVPSEPKLFSNSKALSHYRTLLEKSKYAPATVATSGWKALAKGDNTIQLESPQKDWAQAMEVLAVRKACKFGLEFISSFVGATVHYALDGIDIGEVVGKAVRNLWTFKTGVPITTSELRYLFREWGRYRNSVKLNFYIKQDQTFAPWVTDPAPWMPYAIERVDKYRKDLEDTNEGQLRNFDKHVKSGDAAHAIPWFHDMKVGLT